MATRIVHTAPHPRPSCRVRDTSGFFLRGPRVLVSTAALRPSRLAPNGHRLWFGQRGAGAGFNSAFPSSLQSWQPGGHQEEVTLHWGTLPAPPTPGFQGSTHLKKWVGPRAATSLGIRVSVVYTRWIESSRSAKTEPAKRVSWNEVLTAPFLGTPGRGVPTPGAQKGGRV